MSASASIADSGPSYRRGLSHGEVDDRTAWVDLCVFRRKRSVSQVDRCRHDGKDGRTSRQRRRRMPPDPPAACRPRLERPLDPAYWHGMHTRTLVSDRRGAGCSTDLGSGLDLARPRSANASPARSRSLGRRPTALNPPGGTGSGHTSPPVTVMPDGKRSDWPSSRPSRATTLRRTVGDCSRIVRWRRRRAANSSDGPEMPCVELTVIGWVVKLPYPACRLGADSLPRARERVCGSCGRRPTARVG